MNENDTPTDPRGFDPPSLVDETAHAVASSLRVIVADELRKVITPVTDEQKRARHLMAVLTTQVTAEQARVSRRVAVLESARLAPTLIALALALAAFGTVAAGTAQAVPLCPPGVGGAP